MSAQNDNTDSPRSSIGPGEGATPDGLALALVRALARHAARALRAEQQGRQAGRMQPRPARGTNSGRSVR